MKLRISGMLAVAAFTAACHQHPAQAAGNGGAPTLITLVSFNGNNGANPFAGLITDAAGDLFGTTAGGGASNQGTVFEITKTGGSYASSPTTLVSFNGTNGSGPSAGLIADAAGDLFGTTAGGGASNQGTVFEITKTGGSYASTPTTLINFNYTNGGNPNAGLIADAAGDLFGTTEGGGPNLYGTVFEITKTGGSYASTPTTLVSFGGPNGAIPEGGLIADAAGDLFGTTALGGPTSDGTVFEITKTGGSYASMPTTLVSFNYTNGHIPDAGLIADAAGDLFSTTLYGGANGAGTVFEITKTGGSYASTPTTLVSFNGTNGFVPYAGLITDAAGDLFGTTLEGGASSQGTVFELVNNGGGSYTLTTLVSFNGTNGASPYAGLIADAAGDLFGTTARGGANGEGTVFEITGSGFVSPVVIPPSEAATTASGLAYSRVTRTFNGTVTITNISSGPISGPFSILFTGLTSGVTLANATGNFSGSSYLTVPAVASLAAGQAATVSMQFDNPSFGTINFTPVIYSGSI